MDGLRLLYRYLTAGNIDFLRQRNPFASMLEDQYLTDKTAVITGASAGIGRSTARSLAAEGANVVLAARREDRLEKIAAEIKSNYEGSAVVAPTDVTNEAAVESLIETAVERFGSLDIVIANAGTGPEPGTAVEDLATEQYRSVMGVNVDGMFYTARAAIPHLRETNGNLIFIGSFAGQYPRPAMPLYAATKWWTRGFALSLSAAVGPDGIAVTTINPTEVRTEFGKDYRQEDELFLERFDPGEVTEPEDIAQAVIFAARQEPPNTVSEIDLYRRDKFAGF